MKFFTAVGFFVTLAGAVLATLAILQKMGICDLPCCTCDKETDAEAEEAVEEEELV